MVTLYKNFYTTKPHYVTIQYVVDAIRKGSIKTQIDALRSCNDENEQQRLKKQLPCVLFAGKFEKRADQNLIEHSGFMILDFDHLPDPEGFKNHLTQFPYVYAAFISPRGEGIKAVVKVPQIASKHRNFYRGLMGVFPELDVTSINESRICFMSWDENIYVNEQATEYTDEVGEIKKNKPEVKIGGAEHTDYSLLMSAAGMIRGAAKGQKHHQLLKASKLLGGFVQAGKIEEDEAIRVLEREIQKKGIDDFLAAQQTIRDGIDYGKNEPIRAIDFDYEANKDDIDEYLTKWRENRFEMGLTTGIPTFDKFFRFKRGNFNVVNGFDNIGKSTAMWYLATLSAIYHGWRWIIYSNENRAGSVLKKLMEFYVGKQIDKMTDQTYQRSREFVDAHFMILTNDHLMTAKDLMNIAEDVLSREKYDAMLIDPYNSLAMDYTKLDKVSTHEYHYECASELQIFTKKHDFAIYLNCHVITSALREGKAPKKADTEGGGKFSNKADDFLTFHREVQNPDTWREMEIHVRKIKDLETGGCYTMNAPYILKMKELGVGYADKFGFDPVEAFWNKDKQQQIIELPTSSEFEIKKVKHPDAWIEPVEFDEAPF